MATAVAVSAGINLVLALAVVILAVALCQKRRRVRELVKQRCALAILLVRAVAGVMFNDRDPLEGKKLMAEAEDAGVHIELQQIRLKSVEELLGSDGRTSHD